MEYAVVVCPKCRKAKAVVAGIKTSSCIYCGSKLKVDKLKVFHTSTSSSETAKAAGILNAKLAGGEDAYLEDVRSAEAKTERDKPLRVLKNRSEKDGTISTSEIDDLERSLATGDMQFRMAAIAKTLTEKFGSFTQDNFCDVAARVGIPKERAEKGLEALMRTGLIYEPVGGRFARVESE